MEHHRDGCTAAPALRLPLRRSEGNTITRAEAGIPVDGVPDSSQHEVVLTGIADGRTRLEMTEQGYTTAEARDMSQVGLEQCLDKMAALVAG